MNIPENPTVVGQFTFERAVARYDVSKLLDDGYIDDDAEWATLRVYRCENAKGEQYLMIAVGPEIRECAECGGNGDTRHDADEWRVCPACDGAGYDVHEPTTN